MAGGSTFHLRVRVDGKFFRLGEKKFYIKGVSYGPFAPGADGEPYASRERTKTDFELIQELGANVIRVYELPPRWLLDMAAAHDLKVFIDVPWHKDQCFLDSIQARKGAREAVREAVRASREHPAVFGYSVVNEIQSDIVRWSGPSRVVGFLEELIDVAKNVDSDALCTFANFPPTEFLRPENVDFVCFNLYLHYRRSYEAYLARLQMRSDEKPLVIGEFGIDSLREGESRKCEILSWQIESGFRGGLAGMVAFSFTDDWYRGGKQITDWQMGLTTVDREPKDSFRMVQKRYGEARQFPLSLYPKVSVVVACYNGAETLASCLESLCRLRYPDYEVILVDDGSTDATCEIASRYSDVQYVFQENHGLSVARNTGITAARGEIVAFTDADCRADEDWLYHLVGDLLSSRFSGIGGPNLLPAEDSAVAAAVMVSPGGPAHVMLTDQVAEHIPGCNMAFYKWALEEIGSFDPTFRKAGDDVDVCWRLQQRGYRIGFSAAGFVWHHRRSTVGAYLKQQRGYGEAEALLVRKHPEYFNPMGGSMWRGKIYSSARFGVTTRSPIIYHGVFGTGSFQTLYAAEPAVGLMMCTSLEYHVLLTLPLMVLSVPFSWMLPLAVTSFSISLGVCVAAAVQADIKRDQRRMWSRPLVALLFLLQPIVRGWARYRGRLTLPPTPSEAYKRLDTVQKVDRGEALDQLYYWTEGNTDRVGFVCRLQERLDQQGWTNKADTGWSDYDLEIFGSRMAWLRLATVTEAIPGGKLLFRCRLGTGWSLLAKIGFWAAFGIELLVIGLIAHELEWIWMLLLTMPLFGWYLEYERRHLQRLVAVFLDETAGQLEFEKLAYDEKTERFSPLNPKKTEEEAVSEKEEKPGQGVQEKEAT